MHFSFTHDFDVAPKAYWDLFWSDGYSEDLYRQLGMRSRVVLEQKDEGATIRRAQKMEPDFPVPAWAAAAIKSTAYTEHDLYHKDRSAMDVRIEPALMAERFQMSGVYAVTPLPDGRCRREFRGEVKIAVPLLGGKIEKMMIDQLRDAYETTARVTREWVQRSKAPAA